jgi:hypothetical protein
MSQSEFLKGILPEGTRYSLRLINKQSNLAFNRFFSSIEDMVASIDSYLQKNLDVYYVTAGFGAGSTAAAENAVAKRELYVDVDCGPNKPYIDKTEGVQALKRFCEETHLPKPTLIDSGNGLHAHWVFTEAVPVHEWTPVATRLKALCKERKFHVDDACTADIVRVLRIPETINHKNDSQVVLLNKLRYYEFAALKAVIGQVIIPTKDMFAKARELSKSDSSGLTKSLATGDPNRVSKFETIWIQSVKGEGCAQVKNAINNSETLSEPLWRAVLSIAQYCEDRDWAIHKISENHPNYTPEETEQKAAATKGPYTCETFQGLESSALCANCPHAGKITSPIQIGSTIKVTKPDEKVVAEFAGKRFEIPLFPFPYVRGAKGGVYIIKPKAENEEGDTPKKDELELVYPHDLYVYKRMREAELGDVVWLRHHLPNDGVREFMIAQREVGALDRFRDKLNEQGVTAFHPAQLQKLQSYIAKFIQEMQMHNRADEMHTRFGWTKNDTFVVGDREYTKNGVRHAPVAKGLERYVQWFAPRGTLEEWKAIANMYNDPAFDLHAFGLLTGFGSVLMKLSPENGGVLNYFSKQSGTGKTTILRMVNSIFGDPKTLMKDAQDTQLTKVHRMGLMNGLPMSLDEMTNAKPEEISTMLYGSTQGRARDRMKAGENAERINDVTWKGLSIWSTNASLEDRLGTIKFDPQGEMARVVEIHLRTPVPSDVLEAQKVFNRLMDNYGHAGHVYLSYVIPNLEEINRIWEETRDVIYSKQNWTQTERYRLNLVICALAAGVVTNNLGLTQFNLGRIAGTVTRRIKAAGDELRAQSTRAIESFAAFANKNINNMLSIDSKARANGLQNEPHTKPKGTLVLRYEPDTKSLFIVQKDFNRWCAENFVNAKEMRTLFEEETGQKLDVIKKRMGAGWDADFGAVNAYHIKDAMSVLGLEVNEKEPPSA